MKKCFGALAAVLLFGGLHAQMSASDSIRYYQRELGAASRAAFDSFRKRPEVQALSQNIQRLKNSGDDYGGMSLCVQFSSADFKKFNADNAASGFGAVSGPALGIGYGFTFKKNRRIFDLSLTTFGLTKKTTKGGESIRTSFSSFFQFEWGYDFVKSNRVNLYPFAGFGFRSASLEYKAPRQGTVAPVGIATVVQNDRSVQEFKTSIGYQAGVGFEYVLTKPQRPGGTIVFVKGGTNRAFNDRGFDIAGYRYQPKFNYGDWTVMAGFKFFGR